MAERALAAGAASRYVLGERIAGAVGSIHLGYMRGADGSQRRVAIKRATAEMLEAPRARAEILREAHRASMVRHPNVLSVDDVEEMDGELWLVMDYVQGRPLGDLLGAGRLPLGAAMRIALDVAAGLAAIHEAKDVDGTPLSLVHRDVSPQNILVSLDGVARVTDFGIAKGLAETRVTGTYMRKGRLAYMSPEYAVDGSFTARSDMFSFGVVFWEMLAGQPLFRGATELESLKRVVAAKVPPLDDVPRWIASVARNALARAPDDRFENMTELAEALEMAAPIVECSRPAVAEVVGRQLVR